jgi:hypothetical protein
MIAKISFVGSMLHPLQIPCTGELIFRIPSTGKLISGTATYRLFARQHQLPKIFNVRYAFVAGR